MKISGSVAFILIFLTVAIGSGILSGLQGYTFGYQALQSVRQPDFKPSKKLKPKDAARSDSTYRGLVIVPEEEILKEVKTLINLGVPSRQTGAADGSQTETTASN